MKKDRSTVLFLCEDEKDELLALMEDQMPLEKSMQGVYNRLKKIRPTF